MKVTFIIGQRVETTEFVNKFTIMAVGTWWFIFPSSYHIFYSAYTHSMYGFYSLIISFLVNRPDISLSKFGMELYTYL